MVHGRPFRGAMSEAEGLSELRAGAGGQFDPEVVAAFAGQDVWEVPPDTPGGAVQAPQQPPTSGKGSGLDSWRDYATSLGITVPDDATRDDIIAAVTGQD